MLFLIALVYLWPVFVPVVFGPFLLGCITYPFRALARWLRRLDESGYGWAVLAIILVLIFPFFFR